MRELGTHCRFEQHIPDSSPLYLLSHPQSPPQHRPLYYWPHVCAELPHLVRLFSMTTGQATALSTHFNLTQAKKRSEARSSEPQGSELPKCAPSRHPASGNDFC